MRIQKKRGRSGKIYRRYFEVKTVHALKASLDQDGFLSKVRIDRHGRRTGGKPCARGALYKLLQTRIYLGEIVHKDASYPGQHDAIISNELWDRVQQLLAQNRVERELGSEARVPSLLVGLVYDETGQRMTPTHANKKGVRYRYYVSQPLTASARSGVPRGRRVPARDLERIVIHRLRQFPRVRSRGCSRAWQACAKGGLDVGSS